MDMDHKKIVKEKSKHAELNQPESLEFVAHKFDGNHFGIDVISEIQYKSLQIRNMLIQLPEQIKSQR